tara:strand:- start:389 stop:661 length:273 start_codon:yes stop_codon:yes gene_type:complete
MKIKQSLTSGDLVRFVKNPTYVVPHDKNPIGIVLGQDKIVIGNDPETQSIMEMIRVVWSEPRWNQYSGCSLEHPDDLFLIQSAKKTSDLD